MAKQIIILERPDTNRFTALFWLAVPTARQPFYANPNAGSVYKLADAGELAAIRTGAIVEQSADISFPATTTLTQVRNGLVTAFAAKQAALDALNPWDRYGSFYDGTSWTAGGVV